MSRFFVVAVLVLTVLAPASDVSGCGDKFLLLGRAVGYDKILKASNPGSVVVYTSPKLPSAFNDGRFSALMELAGHQQRSVGDRQALEKALATKKIDLILADPDVSRNIVEYVRNSSNALVVPIATDASAAQQSGLEREFGCMLRLPADARQVVTALDRAMKLKAKRLVSRAA